MTDSADLQPLSDELAALALAVPGVTAVNARPGVARRAARVLRVGGPDRVLTVTGTATLVELDVAIDGRRAAPVVVREVAAGIVERLALEVGLPEATVDVRVVGFGAA